jgi:hypothetical protein
MIAQIKILVIAAMLILNSCADNYNHNEINNNQKKEGSMNTMEMKADTLSESKPIRLKFKSDLNSIVAGENFKLDFIPVLKADSRNPVKLETLHERKAHFIIVSDDLEYFNHIHPVEVNNGAFAVEFVLPLGGRYKLFAEYKPEGYDKITDEFDFVVSGKSKEEKRYESKSIAYTDKEYSVKLFKAEKLIAGEDQTIIAEFYKDGKKLNLNTLDNYLGEKAHAVLISIRDKKFMHVHPMVMDENLNLHINLTEVDYYRLWLQFKINDKVYTSDFVLKALQPNNPAETNNQNKHH